MEDLVHDLPFAIDLQKREQVGEPETGPVIQLKPHGGDGANDVDICNPRLEIGRRTVLVIPGQQAFDGASEQVIPDIPEERRVLVERGFHIAALA